MPRETTIEIPLTRSTSFKGCKGYIDLSLFFFFNHTCFTFGGELEEFFWVKGLGLVFFPFLVCKILFFSKSNSSVSLFNWTLTSQRIYFDIYLSVSKLLTISVFGVVLGKANWLGVSSLPLTKIVSPLVGVLVLLM